MRGRGWWGALFVVALVAGAPRAASAQDEAQAEDLFKQGRAKMDAGQHAEACALFEQSLAFDKAPVTELNLARCYVAIGRVASAWGLYVGVADTVDDAELRAIAEKGARELEPRLPRLAVRTVDPDAHIIVDGRRWTRGVGTVIDPGEHQVEVTGEGKEPWRGRVVAVEGETVTLEVPALRAVAAAGPPAVPGVSAPARPARAPARRGLGVHVGLGVTSLAGTPDPVRAADGTRIDGPGLELGVDLDVRLGRAWLLRVGLAGNSRAARFERCLPCVELGDLNILQVLGVVSLGWSLRPGASVEPLVLVTGGAGVAIGDWDIHPPAMESHGDFGPAFALEVSGGLQLRIAAGPGSLLLEARYLRALPVAPEPVRHGLWGVIGFAGYAWNL
jgi:hypothetical protein